MSSNRLDCCTIVVVEDHEDARTYLGIFLSRLGAKVILAKDGIEGLDAVKKHDPDLVITDLRMPRMDGFHLLREIRGLKREVRGSVPIIAMTAFGTTIENARLANMGFQAWLQKPFTIEKFLGTILAVLDA
jgi:chemosensory pili system protein ChpA (sensor histidine kinase/response regulator)